MLDVFTEEVEVIVKDGIANLYWYKSDLHKAWLRSGVPAAIHDEVIRLRTKDDQDLSKRRQMDALYNRFVGKQKQCIEATSHLFPHFNPYLNKHTLIEIN